MPEMYPEFFRRVTGKEILPYQARYGEKPFASALVIVPTGLGKTDAVLMPWLYAQAYGDTAAPRRLILVLPRQNLTAQTARNAEKRVAAAGLRDQVQVLELMAGSKDNKEDLAPDRKAIIVCTQDMYFSRALNRGYARRPPRWPIDFALYNQDCLLVLDEIQLMDDALATSRQLDAFRRRFGTYGAAPCIWMSATVNPKWLCTVDAGELPRRIELDSNDIATPIVIQRVGAAKRLAAAPPECRDPKGCAAFAVDAHRQGTRTLVIANTVARAREICAAVRPRFPNVKLIHSRFRPEDRQKAASELTPDLPEEGQIVVATQVLEAGIDITARLLITDVAPWGSLVQRFGRVNRYGDDADAEIYWVERPMHSKQKDPESTAPYEKEEIQRATERLRTLTSASPAGLPEEDGPEPWQHVLRRADLMDLFDTTSDLSGNELDVSRFIRATDERDAYLAWREWEGESAPPASMEELADAELCPVPLGELREFIQKKHAVYRWNFATETWTEADKEALFAGMLVVTRAAEGGYTETDGWSPESRFKVNLLQPKDEETEGDSSNSSSFQDYRQTLRAHSDRVFEEMLALLEQLRVEPAHEEALRIAAAKHDWGKAHPVFQKTLLKNEDSGEMLAKQFRAKSGRHERKHFRHELASALAMLATGESDLAAYLVAAHHGKVRAGIRSMPGERETDFLPVARGIREGDWLPAAELANGFVAPAVQLTLGVMAFGFAGESWTKRVLRLRDELGPFRLTYLEMLLRSADIQASANPEPGVAQ